MPLKHIYDWFDPHSAAAYITQHHSNVAFLYSNTHSDFTGQYSFLAWDVKHTLCDDNFDAFEQQLSSDQATLDNAWFGYLGYGLKNAIETLPNDTESSITLPNLQMSQYHSILRFDHQKQKVELWNDHDTSPPLPLQQFAGSFTPAAPVVEALHSNMTKATYLSHVQRIKEAIAQGDLYQANLTRKFYGSFAQPIHGFDLFTLLCTHSPSPYSALFKQGDRYIISSSPERFMHVTSDGHTEIRPIKGSAPRGTNEQEDQSNKEALQNSTKDRAENLMIVDLSRNDLSRHCDIGSVKVTGLFDVTSYATVHHMSSTIEGKKHASSSTLELIQGCFPPGSMTGAPKIKAMELCSEIEQQRRGVYAGALGWFGGDGSADLSVVIRTLITQGLNFEFQVGGAIIADSDPIKEWEETMTKAQGLIKTLGLSLESLESL